MKFTNLPLKSGLQQGLQVNKFITPTEVQHKSIPHILEGKDVIVRSQTGSGKTLAYSLPIIENANYENGTLQALVVCPTRELAMQVAKEIKQFDKYIPELKVVAVYGGSDIGRQIKSLKQRPQIVVGTPGRIMDHINRRTLKLHQLKTVVLDEADEMLNMGFKEDIQSILKTVPNTRQTLLFSATFPPMIKQITHEFLKNPVSVEIGQENRSLHNINQKYVFVGKNSKKSALKEVFDKLQPKHPIVFTNTKSMSETIASLLKENGYKAYALHGDMRQSQRKIVMNTIKQDKNSILVASDVAARGLDIEDVDYVINFDLPNNLEYFLHRMGRTARAGKDGGAITIINTPQQLSLLKDFEVQTNSDIKEIIISSTQEKRTQSNASATRNTTNKNNNNRSYSNRTTPKTRFGLKNNERTKSARSENYDKRVKTSANYDKNTKTFVKGNRSSQALNNTKVNDNSYSNFNDKKRVYSKKSSDGKFNKSKSNYYDKFNDNKTTKISKFSKTKQGKFNSFKKATKQTTLSRFEEAQQRKNKR